MWSKSRIFAKEVSSGLSGPDMIKRGRRDSGLISSECSVEVPSVNVLECGSLPMTPPPIKTIYGLDSKRIVGLRAEVGKVALDSLW